MPDQVIISLESIADDSKIKIDEGRSILTGRELARADSFCFAKHRNRYIRGRALLRLKLSQLIGLPPELIQIEELKWGKPYLVEHPLAFNLSHSEDLAIFAFSFTLARLGVDIEKLERDTDLEKLSQHYFTKGERSEMQKLSLEQRRNLFFKIWTAKEARMKLSGEGLNLDPRQIDLKFTKGVPTGYRKPSPTSLSLQVIEYPELKAVSSIAADKPFEIRHFELSSLD